MVKEASAPEAGDNKKTGDENQPPISENSIQTSQDTKPEVIHGSVEDTKGLNPIKKLKSLYANHKKLTILAAVLTVVLIIFGLSFTKFSVLGFVIKNDYSVHVIDSQTRTPVTGVQLSLAGKTATTDVNGKATIENVRTGRLTLKIQKKYYKELSVDVHVPLIKSKSTFETQLEATGRQVPVQVINKITGKGIAGAKITTLDTDAETNEKGETFIVLPAGQAASKGKVTKDGFNEASIDIVITEEKNDKNNFAITPVGKIYFLSKLSGKIDVVKTNLDGTGRKTVLAGSGKEDESETVLLASRDWKYLALLSKREDGNLAKLYLIDTSNDKLSVMDEGNASFEITGWLDHDFIYMVTRNNVKDWQPKQAALKSFNAETGKITTLDQTAAEGEGQYDYAKEYFGDIYALKGVVIYVKNWQAHYYSDFRLNDKKARVLSVRADGSQKKTLKALGIPAYESTYITFSAQAYEAGGIYFKFDFDDSLFEYEDDKFEPTNEIDVEEFYGKVYPTFLQSPSGKANFWSEERDGKNTLFVGDEDGENGKEIATLSELNQFGWYTDDYLIASKNESELYILSKVGGNALKITDYHKPVANYYGYGGGYGGI